MTMTKQKLTSKLPREPDAMPQPQVGTYDSGYEHSVEHLLEVRRLFTNEADEVRPSVLARLKKRVQAA
jgi:hypothetical protein